MNTTEDKSKRKLVDLMVKPKNESPVLINFGDIEVDGNPQNLHKKIQLQIKKAMEDDALAELKFTEKVEMTPSSSSKSKPKGLGKQTPKDRKVKKQAPPTTRVTRSRAKKTDDQMQL